MTHDPGPLTLPRRTRTWLAVACFTVGLVLAGFFAVRIADAAPRPPAEVGAGAIQLERDGLTLYGSQRMVDPPCHAVDADGVPIPLESPRGAESITADDRVWYVVARSVAPVPPQAVTVDCSADNSGTAYAVGPQSTVVAFVLAIVGVVGSVLASAAVGTTVLTLKPVGRRRVRPGSASLRSRTN
ncbi:hypothetical protein Kfla_1554 [Kribbella flavida DSM 17836]|uniref:Uncharacterized protein n=1 Tax=Kribbella flavida (strain DSM 17836 / JCM 10339 / NBRC 14399) TaxID=479435 RepID=D2PLM3_KRIFD|nr:hypothetical protein [Kribbella flavida]ADB30652.1 hypothetical protein Kfla_1554 [Kribbella flavida DSM 17836]